jgi:hypothetical protein
LSEQIALLVNGTAHVAEAALVRRALEQARARSS